jgi:hypothetical protein
MDKEQLQRVLDEHWPPNRIQLRCSICDGILYDVPAHDNPPIHDPSYIATTLIAHARSHEDDSEHSGFDIVLDAPTKVEREIDCTVTVTGQPEDIESW